MVHLDLNALRKDLDVSYGNWVVTYGEESDPKEVEFHHVLTAKTQERMNFYRIMAQLGRFITNKMNEQDMAELENGGKDPVDTLTDKIKEILRALAVKKGEFDKFARAAGDEYVLWSGILESYVAHYNLSPGEQKPSQNS